MRRKTAMNNINVADLWNIFIFRGTYLLRSVDCVRAFYVSRARQYLRSDMESKLQQNTLAPRSCVSAR